MAQKLFFSLEFQGGAKVISELAGVELELKKVTDEIKAAQKAGDADVYKSLRVQQEDLKRTSAQLRAELKAGANEFEKQKFPIDSLQGLELQYSKLRAEIRGMSGDVRKSADGLAKIKLADSIKTEILQIDGSIKDFKSNIGNYASSLGGGLSSILSFAGIGIGIDAIASFSSASVAAFQESQIAITAVGTAVETTGKAAGFTTAQLAQEAENLMQNTIFDDDEILKSVTSQLLTFTNVTGETFLTAQKAALDLNTVLGGDLQGTTIQLGKALEDPIKGVTALSKAGVTFTAQQKDQIKVLTETGKLQEAQAVILDEINAKYGNQAEALAKTDTGKVKQLTNVFGELQEKVGEFLNGGLGLAAPLISGFIQLASDGFTFLQTQVLEPIGLAFGRLFETISGIEGASKLLDLAFKFIATTFSAVGSIIVTLIDYISSTITYFKELSTQGGFVGATFATMGNFVSDFIKILTDIPALLAATLKTFSQFIQNVRNFDFKTSAIDVGVNEFRRITEEKINKDEKKIEVKPQGVKPPTANKATDDAKKDRDKAAKEAEKAAEEQAKRIAEIQKKIRDLAAADIENEFDKQIEVARNKTKDELQKLEAEKTKLKNKKGAISGAANLQEASLIDKETEILKVALTKQETEINKKRKESQQSATAELVKLQNESLKIVGENIERNAEIESELIQQARAQKKSKLDEGLDNNTKQLEQELLDGRLTQSEFDAQQLKAKGRYNSDLLSLSKQAALDELKVAENLLLAKLQLINTELKINLQNLDTANSEKRKKIQEDLASGKLDRLTADAQLQALENKLALEREQAVLSATDLERAAREANKKSAIDANKAIAESNRAVTEGQLKNLEDEKEKRKQIIEFSLDIARQVSDALFEQANQSAEKEKESALTQLDDQYQKRIELAQGNATVQAGLTKELEVKKLEIERAAFEENKKRQIAQTLINAAVAATAIFAVPDFTLGVATALRLGALAVTTGISVAQIKAQKFATGGFTGNGFGVPDETGSIPVGIVHDNEYVGSKRQIQKYPELFAALNNENKLALRGFASGGFTTTIPQVLQTGSINGGSQISAQDMKLLSEMIANSVYEAAKVGTQQGSKEGIYLGASASERLRERSDALATNTEF